MLGLDERLPQFPHTDTLASSMLGAYRRTHDGLEMHGSTILRFPARFRSWGLEGVPMVTIRGHKALDRDFPNIQALGCAQGGMPGRYGLMVLPLLITMAFEVNRHYRNRKQFLAIEIACVRAAKAVFPIMSNDQLFHCWSKIFPLKRHRYDLTGGVKHGCGCRYQCQSVHG